ncbi:hypothetical protein [Paenibacillus agricola]|uniref:Uncharacterized protein n=1 Tax=Paenibacillus agricola TaxID=2716264 RepID=A0ABX0JHX3_9BACL|nr:hypothetical protein [Paenibacillus agricola]NHN34891.1 hypothetical protein [Paenibacillus agricola]
MDVDAKRILESCLEQFPDQIINLKQNHNKITLFQVQLSYDCIGNRIAFIELVLLLTREWDFLSIETWSLDNEAKVTINYDVKPQELLTFLSRVKYRGQTIHL